MSGWSSTSRARAPPASRAMPAKSAGCSRAIEPCSRISSAASSTLRSPMAGSSRPRTPICARSPGISVSMRRIMPASGPSMSALPRTTPEDPYAILGVAARRPAAAIREAYHRLVRESHPDLVIAQGLPPECIALATARVARINAAYEQITKAARRTNDPALQICERTRQTTTAAPQPRSIDMLVLHYTGMPSAEAASSGYATPRARSARIMSSRRTA